MTADEKEFIMDWMRSAAQDIPNENACDEVWVAKEMYNALGLCFMVMEGEDE